MSGDQLATLHQALIAVDRIEEALGEEDYDKAAEALDRLDGHIEVLRDG